MTRSLYERMLGGLIGLIVGDALGVPAEFRSREQLQNNPITDMVGYGSHNQPPGTWSDDSSMTLCTVEALLDKKYDLDAIMGGFQRWLFNAHMTPYGKVFDVGNATQDAIISYDAGTPALECGGTDEFSNGNGSLMRILPVTLYMASAPDTAIIKNIFQASALTHAHIRSQLCCAVFSLVVRDLLLGKNLSDALMHTMVIIEKMIPASERAYFARRLDGTILSNWRQNLPTGDCADRRKVFDYPNDIRSGGHVIDTLEASLWCCANASGGVPAVVKIVS